MVHVARFRRDHGFVLWTIFEDCRRRCVPEVNHLRQQLIRSFIGKGHIWVTMLSGSGFQVALGYILRRQHPAFISLLKPLLLNKKSKHMREQHISMSREMALKRINSKNVDRVDLFSHLVGSKAHNTTVDFLAAQGSTLVAAGTETTSTFLSAVTYYLLKNPTKMDKLKNEVRQAYSKDSEIDGENTKKLFYLNAVIEEGLRIFPPAPFGLPRVCPGADIDGAWVPKGVCLPFLRTLDIFFMAFNMIHDANSKLDHSSNSCSRYCERPKVLLSSSRIPS